MSALFEVVYLSSMVSTSLPLPINKRKKGQVMKKIRSKVKLIAIFLPLNSLIFRAILYPIPNKKNAHFPQI